MSADVNKKMQMSSYAKISQQNIIWFSLNICYPTRSSSCLPDRNIAFCLWSNVAPQLWVAHTTSIASMVSCMHQYA